MARITSPLLAFFATSSAAANVPPDEMPQKIPSFVDNARAVSRANLVPAVLNRSVAHEIVPVSDVLARDTARALSTQEGIFCGISSGGTFAAALEVAKQAKSGDVILAMLPDTGERYLSTFLFEGINEGTDVELADL